MMKRVLCPLAALLVIIAMAGASGFPDRWSFRLSPGGIMPLGGSYSDTTKLGKVVSIGAALTAGLRYRVTDYFFIGADYGLTWMPVSKDYRPFDYREQAPALNVEMAAVSATFVLSTEFGINPYVTFGAGIYPWEFSQKPLLSTAWPAPADPTNTFAKNSLGFNTGLGAEKRLSARLSIFAEVMYHYVLARDPKKFGTDDFNEQDFLGLNIGLSYAFGKR
jgi:opacity protein-like surface antigen